MRLAWLGRVMDLLSSVKLAVVTMAVLAVVCGTATVYESKVGTAAAQRHVYGTAWFAFLLALLGVNVFLSMIQRWPWRVHHIGFLAAHFGILYILVGSVVSLHLGLDGTLALQEGESSSRVALPGSALRVSVAGGSEVALPLEAGARQAVPGTDLAVTVTNRYEHVGLEETIAAAEEGTPALSLHLKGGFGEQHLALLAGHPGRGHAEFGPVGFTLDRAESADEARKRVAEVQGRSQATFVMAPGGVLHYGLASRKAPTVTGTVQQGAELPTPWMDITLGVEEVIERAALQRQVVPQPAPEKESRRIPAVQVRLERGGQLSEPRWIVFGEEQVLSAGEAAAQVGFGNAQTGLPFEVSLLDFHSERYPGSSMPATYESRVRIVDPQRGTSEHHISMNKPLHYDGYTFFQASYAEGPRMTSIFSVSRAPGLPLVYFGTVLMTLGTAWMFYLKPWLARRAGQAALREAVAAGRVALAGLALAALAVPAQAAEAGDPLRPLRLVAVQDGGRLKPLDTFARETAKRLTGARAFGAESVAGLDPVEWMVAVAASPERWREERFIRVTSNDARRLLSLPGDRDRYSFGELVAHEPFLATAEALRARLDADPEAKLDAGERDVLSLYDTLSLYAAVIAGDAPLVVPTTDPAAAWRSFRAVEAEGGAPAALAARAALVEAYRRGDRGRLPEAAETVRAALSSLPASRYPTPVELGREVQLNQVKPFRTAWMLYLLAFLAFAASFPLASARLGALGYALVALGLGLHTWGMALRTLVAGRAPVTNMYETVVFSAWGALLIALGFELKHRARVFAACASALAVIFLLVADNAPIMDGAIDPLVPVLRDNFWLTTHVLTIMLGYAAFFLAVALAHVVLWQVLFEKGGAALRARLSTFLYRTMQVGTLFLAAGTVLGGVWASYSWGRFWGWDPKETWSLIALLVYLAVIHARFAGWVKDVGLALGALVGGLTVLMAWYGVNFILGTGLHSYGFGSGGIGWVIGYTAFELAVIAATVVRTRRERPGALAAPAQAHPANA